MNRLKNPTRIQEQDGERLDSLKVVERKTVSMLMTIMDGVPRSLHAVRPRPVKQNLQEEADETDVMMFGASFEDIQELYFTSCQGINSPFFIVLYKVYLGFSIHNIQFLNILN